jgi:hypothetical protein
MAFRGGGDHRDYGGGGGRGGDPGYRERDRERGERDRGEGGRRGEPPPRGEWREAPCVDRERTCPFLIRVFVRQGDHSSPRDFYGMDGVPCDDGVTELHFYTWEDANLLELAELVRERLEDARTRRHYKDGAHGATIKHFPDQHFVMIYPDREG